MTLVDYRTLGNSGLVVSPMALGTMTFGNENWGSSDAVSRDVFNHYVDAGGNFVDTADVYSGGKSEELVGKLIADRKLRDKIVLATKYSFNGKGGNPNGGGNGRKNLYRSVENSLSRLKTDYIDMYWMHVWDMVTPVEEVLQSMGHLVRQGKIRYFGFSDMPAWYASAGYAFAKAYNAPKPIAQQMHYALTERTIEQEHVAAAKHSGQGIVAWSPLAYGFLTGKYKKGTDGQFADSNGRLSKYNPMFPEVTEKHWAILKTLENVALETDYSMAQVALSWVVDRSGITSTLIGASKADQIKSNIAALDIVLNKDQKQELDKVSALAQVNPYLIFNPQVIDNAVFGGHHVSKF